jgi:predicted Zn-dependent peptidase
MSESLQLYRLSNGMILLGEPMAHVESAAFVFLVPCGSARIPKGCSGAGNVILDWIFRGAGNRNTRQLIDAMDGLGLHRHCSITSHHLLFGAAMENSRLRQALDLYADILLRPKLESEQFEPSRELAVQELQGLEDEPRQKVMMLLFENFYPDPLGRPSLGTMRNLRRLTSDTVRTILDKNFHPSKGIFSIAGHYDFDRVFEQLESLFGRSRQCKKSASIRYGKTGKSYHHVAHDGAQVHIGLMTPTIPITHPDYYHAMAAVSVLSGSMSSRLFTEVREKRGLCYAVGARYHTLQDIAGISCYAGTTPEKAQETLDVVIGEFQRLREGIVPDELQRAKIGLKSTLIMQSESTSSRSGGIASDYHLLGRVRSLDEIKNQLDQLSVESVNHYLRENLFERFSVVTIGPKDVHVSE